MGHNAPIYWNVVLTLVAIVILPLIWRLWSLITKAREDLTAHKLNVAENYVKLTSINPKFNSLERKIDEGNSKLWRRLDELADMIRSKK